MAIQMIINHSYPSLFRLNHLLLMLIHSHAIFVWILSRVKTMRETKPIITLENISEWNTGLYFRGNLTLVEQRRESSRILSETPLWSNNRWLPRKGVALAMPIVRAVEADRTKGGADRPGRTRGMGIPAIIISCRSRPVPSQTHRQFCNIRVLIVAWFLNYLRPSYPPTARSLLPRLSHSPPFRPLRPRTLKQNEGDARRALKDNDYET